MLMIPVRVAPPLFGHATRQQRGRSGCACTGITFSHRAEFSLQPFRVVPTASVVVLVATALANSCRAGFRVCHVAGASSFGGAEQLGQSNKRALSRSEYDYVLAVDNGSLSAGGIDASPTHIARVTLRRPQICFAMFSKKSSRRRSRSNETRLGHAFDICCGLRCEMGYHSA